MPKFMLFVHHTPGEYHKLSSDQIQQRIQRYREWLEGIRDSGRYVVSDKLMEDGGKIVSRESEGVMVVDGPYSESKEVVGGFFTIRAKDYDEALSIARESPFLESGPIAVRQVDPMGCGDDE